MAGRKKKAKFRSLTAVKELARERIGMPPPSRIAANQKKKAKRQEKHKPTLERLLEEGDQDS